MRYLNELRRHLSGSTPSARVHNAAADEVDALELSLVVRRTAPLELREGMLPPNVNRIVQWHEAMAGTGSTTGGDAMWTPAQPQFVTIRRAGVYLVGLQLRFGHNQYLTETSTTYSSYSGLGRRWARIMLNGTSPVSDTIGQKHAAGSAVGEIGTLLFGMSMQAWTCRALYPGDTLWAGTRQSAAANGTPVSIPGLHQDFGGTWMALTRVGPAAPLDLEVGA